MKKLVRFIEQIEDGLRFWFYFHSLMFILAVIGLRNRLRSLFNKIKHFFHQNS